MLENKIISCFISSREAFDRLIPIIKETSAFSPFAEKVVGYIGEFYSNDPAAKSVDLDVLRQRLVVDNPKKDFLVEEFLSMLPKDFSVENVVSLYEELYRDNIRMQLIHSLNNKDDEKTEKLMEELQTFSVEEKEESVFNATPIEELNEHFTGRNLIPIYPTALSDSLGGGVPRQSQLCIMARPDVGKSVAAINMAVGAAEKGFKVLYIGNEDPAPKMVLRILSRFLRQPEAEIRKSPKKSYEEAMKRGYGNVFFLEMHPGNYAELRKAIEKYTPDVVVLDQIRNMHFKAESMTMNLEAGVIACRNLAKEFNHVSIVVTQAGDSASNKLVLEMNDVEWSNTGVAAQMDLMVGVGQNPDLKERGLVVLSFPKNKFTAPIKPITANIEYDKNRITVNQ